VRMREFASTQVAKGACCDTPKMRLFAARHEEAAGRGDAARAHIEAALAAVAAGGGDGEVPLDIVSAAANFEARQVENGRQGREGLWRLAGKLSEAVSCCSRCW
jgi:hypothetical protein